MYKKFDILFSEVLRSHYIVIWADFNTKIYILQEFDPVKQSFKSVLSLSHKELEDNHFHINGESRIRKRIKELAYNLDMDDFANSSWGDVSERYYDIHKTEKILLEACGLKPFKKNFDNNPVIKENHSGDTLGTMEFQSDGNSNLVEISFLQIPENESIGNGNGENKSVVTTNKQQPTPSKINGLVNYWKLLIGK